MYAYDIGPDSYFIICFIVSLIFPFKWLRVQKYKELVDNRWIRNHNCKFLCPGKEEGKSAVVLVVLVRASELMNETVCIP